MQKIAFFFLVIFMGLASIAWGASITDNAGQVVEFDKPFTRIISLYSAHTENIASLGAENELIGIYKSDDYPASVLSKKRYSYREDAEKFIAAAPDLVIVRPMIERAYPQLLEKLRQAGIIVVSLQPTSVEGIFSYWQALGTLTGRSERAEEMIHIFKNGLAAIKAKVDTIPQEKRVRVYFESIHKKMKTFAPESISMFVLEQAGGINVATDAVRVRKTNIAAYGKERILAKADEIDLFLAQKGRMNRITMDTIKNEPGFQAIKAVANGNISIIDERIVSRPTMRILDGIRILCKTLYPEIWQNEQIAGPDDDR